MSVPAVRILDIEGTTTSVGFVYDVLFAYARQHVERFVEQSGDEPAARAAIERLAADAAEEAARGESCPVVDRTTRSSEVASVVAVVNWAMDRDRKTPGLKALQGVIWQTGYLDGSLQSDVYDDVPLALRRWHESGARTVIYSSGSVAAQKLLFTHSRAGDLTPWLDGYFDTGVGPKREPASYRRICAELGLEPGKALFVTDIVAEADAAVEAGLGVAIAVRPGNAPQPAHAYRVVTGFDKLEG
jgi:2,3-diketo-5-methylthio-1-phosphopentane phosphatase